MMMMTYSVRSIVPCYSVMVANGLRALEESTSLNELLEVKQAGDPRTPSKINQSISG